MVWRAVMAMAALLLAMALAAPGVGRAQDEPSCANPSAAASSMLDWLQPDSWDPQKAITCVDVGPRKQQSAQRLTIQLKQVLDARGLYVPVGELPTDPDHVDEHGEHRVVPVPALPVVVLERLDDGRWVYSRGTMNSVPGLYKETFSSFLLAVQERLPSVFFTRIPGINLFLWQILYFLLLVAASLGVGRLAQLILAQQVVLFAKRLGIAADLKLIRRIRGPLIWFAGGLVFLWGVPDLQLGVRASFLLHGMANAMLSIAAVVMAVRVVDLVADLFERRAKETDSKLDDQVIPLVSRATKVGLWTLGLVFILQNLGVEVTALLAGVSVGGVAVALAAQDTVGNLFGSLTIFTDRPFQIGDWVVIDGDVEGVVEEVGFRSTRIRTFYKSVISVPNAKVANTTVDNIGQRPYRRMKMTIGLTYGTTREQMQAFVTRVRALMEASDKVWDGSLEVHFNGFGASSLDVLIYSFLDVPDWSAELREKERILFEIMHIAEEVGVSFALPSTSVYLERTPTPPSPPQVPR